MNLSKQFQVPNELKKYQKQLERSLLPSVKIDPIIMQSSFITSKFSGLPYLPINHSYPKDIDGQYMFFIAQINFSQLNLDSPFPKHGILQFFISPTLYKHKGAIEEQLFQHYFKVRYYSNLVSKQFLTNDFTFLKDELISSSPITTEMALNFTPYAEPVSAMDFRVNQYFEEPLSKITFSDDDRTLEDIYIQYFLGAEHKIGGYPYFIHFDTRQNSHFLKRFDTLLLQIVSNDEQNIMWGDSGTIKFFISKQNLMNLDFSEVYFVAEQYE